MYEILTPGKVLVMESECGGQCRFCLDQMPARDVRISNEDMKMYKDVFDSVKMYLNEDEGVNRISFDWTNSCGLLSPFCQNCFQSAEIIHGVRKQLEEIQENLNVLTHKFKQDVKLRASKNGVEKCNISVVKCESEVIFDELDEDPFLHSEEELKFSKNIPSNISWSGDDDQQFNSGDGVEESKIINSTDQWPRVCLERLELHKDRKNKKLNYTVSSAVGKKKSAASILQKTDRHLDGSRGLCNDNVTTNERNPSLGKSYECYLCKKLFKDKKDLNRHLSTHNIQSVDNNAFQCSVCNKNFKHSRSLKRHAKLHGNQLHSNSCNKSFESKDQLGQHMPQEHGKESMCNICGRLCKDEASLKRHGFRAHKIKRSFECEKCGFNFKNKTILRKHVQVVHDKILNFKCTTCGKCFGASGALKQHEKTHEDLSERRKFQCEICGDKYFVTLKNLTIHQKQFHTVFTDGYTGENHFVCETCGKAFIKKSHFEEHLRVHTSDRPFCCDFCGSAFALQTTLRKHILIHTGEKPHKCTFCEKCYRQSHQLKTHLRSHTGERPYSCSVCARTFTDRSTWYRHEKTHKQKWISG